MEFASITKDPELWQVREQAKLWRLAPPIYEDAIYFFSQFPWRAEEKIVFPHDPVSIGGSDCVLVGMDGEIKILPASGTWGPGWVFALVNRRF